MLKKLLKDKLVAKYPGILKKLTSKGQGLLVEKLSTKVTTEDELEDFVNGLENTIEVFVDVIVSESDRRVREAGKAPSGKEGEDAPEGGAGAADDKGNAENQEQVPAWAKGLQETVTNLQKQLAGEKSKNTQSELIAAAKAKGIPEHLVKRYQIGDDFNQETALSELETDWTEMKQLAVNGAVGGGRVPKGTGGSTTEASKEEVDSVLNKIM